MTVSQVLIAETYRSDRDYMNCVGDIIDHPLVASMKNYCQHGVIDCLKHSLFVSYVSYQVCKRMGFDYMSAARGGLLHDFFLYDWHTAKKPGNGPHGFTHPRIALQNARAQFELNDREQEIIRKHMWPLTPAIPRYRETYVVVAVDKYCAFMESFNRRAI